MNLHELLDIEPLRNSKITAGHGYLNREVRDIAVMEVPDIEDYVKKGDFLLTTFFPIHKNPRRLRHIIPALHRIGLCGIGIKPNRYLDKIPDIMIEQADALGFPLVTISDEVNFSDVMAHFLREKLRIRNTELEYRDTLHRATMEMLMQGYGFDELAANIQDSLGMEVLFLSNDRYPVVLNGESAPDKDTCQKLAQYCKDLDFKQDIQTIEAGRDAWVAFPVVHSFRTTGYILLKNNGNDLTEIDKITVEQYESVFTLIQQKALSMSELERRYSSEFAYDLLFREPLMPDLAVSRARTIGWNLFFPVVIVIVDLSDIPLNEYQYRDHLSSRIRQEIFQRCGVDNEQLFIANIGSEIVLLLNEEAIKRQREIIETAHLVVGYDGSRCHIGISNPVADISSFQQRFRDGRKAVDIARLTGHTAPLAFRDVGIYRVLYHRHIREELSAFCEDTIGPVIEHDKQRGTDYLRTLEMLFACSGNHKKAAEALYLHYNTFRYRTKVIARLLGLEPSLLHACQDVYLAVTAYKLFYKKPE